MDRARRTIAIVGAGFSGTATAVHLLRQVRQDRTQIVLIERGHEFGRGVAYASAPFPFVLNVPASRMSATTADPDEFLRFARRFDARISAGHFLPRRLYGDYLQSMLREAAAAAWPGASLECQCGEVVDVEPERTGRVVVTMAGGRHLLTDDVVLALGNPPARRIDAAAPSTDLDEVLGRLAATTAVRLPRRLVVLGTGLSMVDAVLAVLDHDPEAEIHALSRHGLVPRGQTDFTSAAFQDHAHRLTRAAGSIARLVTVVRDLASEADRSGSDWREVITLVRQEAPALWRALDDSQRRRFLRHVRSYWEVHRHRLPPSIARRIEALRSSAQLVVHAGRLASMRHRPQGVDVSWQVRGSDEIVCLDAVAAINCTGPNYDLTRTADPLWCALVTRGIARPDAHALGVLAGPNGELLGRDDWTSHRIFYIGPMLRADHWEATAVGELRVRAERLAQHLINPNPRIWQ